MPATGAEFSACWVTQVLDPTTFTTETITRCRIAGGETIDYASDDTVPSTLYPNLGSDLTGQCWYLTSATTQYVIITQFADGSAEIGFDTDPANPGGIIAIGPILPRCTSEPTPASDPQADAWNYVMSYVHDPPTPDLNPAPGDGITGLETFIGVVVPSDHNATISSGATTVEVDIDVSRVIVRWGDGTTVTYPPIQNVLAGHPDGSAIHIYEEKGDLAVIVEYDWSAQWRLVGGSWASLPVPNTTTSLGYPVAEVVSTLDP